MGLFKKKSDGKFVSSSKSGTRAGAVVSEKTLGRSLATGEFLSVTNRRTRQDRAKLVADDNPFAVFTEWNGKADDDAYGSL